MSNITDYQLKTYIDVIFARYDRDRSGTLSSFQLVNFFNDLFTQFGNPRRVSQQQANEAIRAIDINHDGQASKQELFLAFKKLLNTPNVNQNYGTQQGYNQNQQGYNYNQQPNYNQGYGMNQGYGQPYGQQPMGGQKMYGQSNYGSNDGWGQQPQNTWGNQPPQNNWGNQPQNNWGNQNNGWNTQPKNNYW